MDKDWSGRDIVLKENLEDSILVWEISPSIDDRYDYVWIRSYKDAVQYAEQVAAHMMDDLEEDALKDGITINIKIVEVTLEEYKNIEYANQD